MTVYRLLFSVLSSIPLCQQQPGFCSDTVVVVCLSGFDVIIVCLRARDTKDYLNRIWAARASGLRGRNPIRMAFQTTSRCGFGLICKNRISCIFGCHDIQKSILLSQKMDRSWQTEHMLQVKQVYSELLPFSFCAQNTRNNLLNVLHSNAHYPWTIQEDLRNSVFYNSCQWALFFWNTLDIFVHPDIFPNEGNLDFWGWRKSLESFECFVVWNAAGVTHFIDFQKPYLRSFFISEWTLSLEKTVCVIMKNP